MGAASKSFISHYLRMTYPVRMDPGISMSPELGNQTSTKAKNIQFRMWWLCPPITAKSSEDHSFPGDSQP